MEAQGYIDPDPITGTSKGHRDKDGKLIMYETPPEEAVPAPLTTKVPLTTKTRAKSAQKCAKNAQTALEQPTEGQPLNPPASPDTKNSENENKT
jgi:hypothetical protein